MKKRKIIGRKKEKKFNRTIGSAFAFFADQKTHMSPGRALRILTQLKNRAIIDDARTFRQKQDEEFPLAHLSVMEHKALTDAIRLFGVRLQLLYKKAS